MSQSNCKYIEKLKMVLFFFFFDTGSHYGAQAGLEVATPCLSNVGVRPAMPILKPSPDRTRSTP